MPLVSHIAGQAHCGGTEWPAEHLTESCHHLQRCPASLSNARHMWAQVVKQHFYKGKIQSMHHAGSLCLCLPHAGAAEPAAVRWGGAMHGQAGSTPASQPLSCGCNFLCSHSDVKGAPKRPQPSGFQSRPPAMASRTAAGTSHDVIRGCEALNLADLPDSVLAHALGFLDFRQRWVWRAA